jgi:uroporphyrinogen decarboxylase
MFSPDFNNVLKILNKQSPSRPTLFELFVDDVFIERLSGIPYKMDDLPHYINRVCLAMKNGGYDHVALHGSGFRFERKSHDKKVESFSMNSASISDVSDIDAYPFPDPDKFDYSRLSIAEKVIPKGMKVVCIADGGVLENVIQLVGYENLCMLLYDSPETVERLFREVGERFLRYYERCLEYDVVGAVCSNDDWGFNTSTMLSPADMRKYVFPYHKRIVELSHKKGRPALLHSCGKLDDVYEEIILDLGFDGKHSNEDNILPVETAYSKYGGRIAILGGIDLDFLCRSTEEEIYARSKAMIKTGVSGYALGSGNSLARYLPFEKYQAMTKAVRG